MIMLKIVIPRMIAFHHFYPVFAKLGPASGYFLAIGHLCA
jgi:hypothetical protein